jgi:prepilin-type processing-associated H-X9-DG protein
MYGSIFAAPILGFAALIHIKCSKKILRGKGLAIPAITIPLFLIILVIVVMPQLGKVRKLGSRLVCGTCVKGLGTVFKVYAYDYDDRLPTAESWCDLFICYADVSPKSFRCPESDVIIGESAYALNENIVGMKPSEIPGDVVLMFETSLGRTDEGRTGQVKSRGYFQFFAGPEPPEMYSQEQKKEGNRKIYIDRWNQVGGPEDITTEYHKGIGCNVLFGDGHSEFVKTKDLGGLRWEP